MDFDEYDRCPEDELNRILWAATKGENTPYPTPIHRVLFTSGGVKGRLKPIVMVSTQM